MSHVYSLIILCSVLCIALPVWGDSSDCFWGGRNETTTYSSTYVPGMGGVTLAQYTPAPMNLGAPPPALPVQATPGTQAIQVPQANIPTITIPTGPVGTVGQPATFPGTVVQAPPGAEIVYILPSSSPSQAVILNGQQTLPTMESKVVPATTPGAIPVALKTVTVRRPKIEYQWVFAPIEKTSETTVQVVNPRTGRVVRTYGAENTEHTFLPWLHRREIVSYETVEAKYAVPVSVAPTVSTATNTFIQGGNVSVTPFQGQ